MTRARNGREATGIDSLQVTYVGRTPERGLRAAQAVLELRALRVPQYNGDNRLQDRTMETTEEDQEPPTPYQAGYAFGDQYRQGPGGAALARLHPISTDYLVFMGEAMWTGGAECERLGFSSGTFDGVRFKEGFVAGLYGRVSEEDLVAEIERIETAPRSADVTVTDVAGRSVDPGDYVKRHWLPAK